VLKGFTRIFSLLANLVILKVVEGKWAVIACGRRKKDDDQLIRLVYLYNTGKETIKCLRYLKICSIA
jgi:hypothetical protein